MEVGKEEGPGSVRGAEDVAEIESDGDSGRAVLGGKADGRGGNGGVRSRRKRPRTTVPGDPAGRPSDLLGRCFGASAPNRRWLRTSRT